MVTVKLHVELRCHTGMHSHVQQSYVCILKHCTALNDFLHVQSVTDFLKAFEKLL